MKILIVGFTKISYMPYMNFYIDELIKSNNEIHLFYWNRDNTEDITPNEKIILHTFENNQKDEVAKIKKVKNFFEYRKVAKELINTSSFDFVIVLHTLPAVLIADLLVKKYKGKYILDYRDATFERFSFFKKIIAKLVNKSLVTFVSSDGFRELLPVTNKIYTSHNILEESLDFREIRRIKERNKETIIIRFWGFIRHEKTNKLLINRLKNDNRFEIHYHGREQETALNLKQMCQDYEINNVYFHGSYLPRDRYQFAENTDILHNLYDNDDKTDMAMGNKYYDGVIFYLPQLCNLNSLMGKMVTKNHIGFECDLEQKDFSDKLYHYYQNINWSDFNSKCDDELERIMKEYAHGKEILSEIFK